MSVPFVPFAAWTLEDCRKRIAGLRQDSGMLNRRYYDGDHWQGGTGWGAALPDDPAQRLTLEQQFTPEPLIAEVVDNHRDGVIGREPIWRFVPAGSLTPRSPRRLGPRALAPRALAAPPDDPRIALAESALTEVDDERDYLLLWQRVVVTLLLYGRAPVRLYVPSGLRDDQGHLAAVDLAAALRLFHLQDLAPESAGVFTDPTTAREIGVFLYREGDEDRADLSYLNPDGTTTLRVINGGGVVDEIAVDLGGRLTIYELRAAALIGDVERRNQRLADFAKTVLGINAEVGAWQERNFINIQPPGYWEAADGTIWTPGGDKPRARFVELTLPTGPRVDRFLQGADQYGPDGAFRGTASGQVAYQPPAPVDVIERVILHARGTIYKRTGQQYLDMAGDAVASGVSRVQARSIHETRLRRTKIVIDGAIRWDKEVRLAWASYVLKTGEYNDLRAEGNALIHTGQLLPDERAALLQQWQAGALSLSSFLALTGADDPDAEIARIETERQAGDAALMGVARPAPAAQPGQQAPVDPAAVLAAQLGQGA